MKPDDPIFIELALKAISSKATPEEHAKLKEMLMQPELAKEYKQLQADMMFAKEVLPLMGDEPATVPPLSDFELSRMRKLADERQQRLAQQKPKPSWSFRWVFGLASAAAVILLAVLLLQPSTPRTIQVAMLDSMGTSRGTNDINTVLLPALKENFGQTNLVNYTESTQLNAWLNEWPNPKTVKIVYDRDASEVRVISRDKTGQTITKKFPVMKETDLPAVLKQAAESFK